MDSEVILGSLKREGCRISDVEKGVDVCIVNTCAFIGPAREESIDAILEACRLKREGKAKHLVVCGCLPQLYRKDIAKSLEEVDLVLGTSDFIKIASFLKSLQKRRKTRQAISDDLNYLYDENSPRFLLTPRHYAYVKISEGCSNFCSFCIISRLRGRLRSRTIESVSEEVKRLASGNRLKEIILIGQDTTAFGIDRYGKMMLAELLKRICALKNNIRWVRILYTHPAHYTDELISVIRDEDKICKYLDIPVQHISDRMLRLMNRRTTKEEIVNLIENIRKRIPGVVLRTSVITGFPGETDKDFNELLKFLSQTRFERLGAFIYSKEEKTAAARLKNQIPEKIKCKRLEDLMKLQQKISYDINKDYLGKTIDVLIDEKIPNEANRFSGRTQGDAPDVDGVVYVTGEDLKIGEFYNVKVTDTLEYDLAGEALR